MNQIYLRWLFLSLCLMLSSQAWAQVPAEPALAFRTAYPELRLAMRYLQPTDALWANGYRRGFGFNLEWMSQPLREARFLNFQFGGSLDYDFTGHEQFEYPVTYPYRGDAELRIGNTQLGLHGAARLITSQRFPVQAYVQGMVGTRVFFATETFELEIDHDTYDLEDCPEPETDVVRARPVLSYGGSAGMRMQLGQGVWLDLRGTYLTGTGTEFADLRTANLSEGNSLSYELASSPTSDQWSVSAGITFQLRGEEETCEDDDECGSSFFPGFWWGGCR